VPFVRIDVPQGRSAEYRQMIGDVVYDAMIATIDVPPGDRFQVIADHRPADLIIDPTYLGVQRSRDCIIIQITLNEGRTVDKKKAFYKAIVDGLHDRVELRREDVVISLIEVKKENWSFGNGEMQYGPK
jgi:4-oxalocrotonate tautomerase